MKNRTKSATAAPPTLPKANGHNLKKHAGAVTSNSYRLYKQVESWSGDETVSVLPAARDNCKDVTTYTHSRMMQFGRLLYVNVPFIGGMIDEIANYVVGDAWQPKFMGADQEWGKLAQDRLAVNLDQSDLMGGAFNWSTGLRIAVASSLYDGDKLMVKTFAEVNGFRVPKLQWIAAHRISSRGRDTVPKGSAYAGKRCDKGVVTNEYGAPLAFQVTVDDNEKNDIFIPAAGTPGGSAHLIYSPLWSDQSRGQTALARCIQEMVKVDHITDWEMFAAQLYAMTSFIEKVESDGELGEGAEFLKEDADGVSAPNGTPVDSKLIEESRGGTIRKFRAGAGTDIRAFEQNRPSPNLMNFRRELMRSAYASLNWPIEFSYDTKELNSAATRLVIAKVSRTVTHLQNMLWPAAAAAVRHFVRFNIASGMLPENDEWFKWDFNYPRIPTIDVGREAREQREDYKTGLTNMRRIYGDQSEAWKEEIMQRIEEQRFIQAACEAAGVDLNRVQLLTPNGNMPLQGQAQPADAGAQAKAARL